MIVINKDSINNIVFTLEEKNTNVIPFYLLELINTNSKEVKYMPLGVDISECSLRYNEFVITEAETDDLENQIINLEYGYYDYKVYSNDELVLVPDNDSILVEQGNLVVNGTLSTIEYDEQSKTNIIYYGD